MKVLFQNQTIEFDPKKSVGSGGEANVIEHNGMAFKIYHDPTPERAAKLKDFISNGFNLTSSVLCPLDVTKDVKTKSINGFSMNLASKKCKVFIELSNIDYRSKSQFDIKDVVKIFFNAKSTLDLIHKAGLIVGDYNDVNILFSEKSLEIFYIDVDSFQFGKYPCLVGTDDFLDPNLYGIDLTKKPMFTKETDWYSFSVMLFKSLLFVHPYGGMHKQHKTLFRRAENKIWVLDKGIIYPKNGLRPEILSDEMLGHFEKIFSKGKRLDLPVPTLQSLEDDFIKCNKCGISFSKTRSKCPGCQVVIPQAVNIAIISAKQVDKEVCEMVEIFKTEGTTGTILFLKVIDNQINIIHYTGKSTILTRTNGFIFNEVVLWQGFDRNFSYDMFLPDCLVVGNENEVMIFDVSGTKLVPISKITTLDFKGSPMFACSQNSLYRLTTNMMMKGKMFKGNYVEEDVTTTIENQTWFKVGDNDLGIGYFRIFSKLQFFVFSKKGRYEIEMDDIDGQMIDIDVCFSLNSLLLLRKFLHRGRTYSYWNIISDEGKILESKKEESINSELLKNIHGKQLAGSNIIHPTDAGIVIEKHGDLSLKETTAPHLSDDCAIRMYKNGLLVISRNKVVLLTLKK